jgi:hypothetical protein
MITKINEIRFHFEILFFIVLVLRHFAIVHRVNQHKVPLVKLDEVLLQAILMLVDHVQKILDDQIL